MCDYEGMNLKKQESKQKQITIFVKGIYVYKQHVSPIYYLTKTSQHKN